jgi:hypothetical protein
MPPCDSDSGFIALGALEHRLEPASPTLLARHPATNLPGRIMTHVLAMAALQLGHPVPLLVLMEAGYASLHVITRPERRTLRHPA